MHTGSLVAALAGFLEARVRGGEWRLRVEDIDTPRVVPGAADAQLRTLEALGLTWDGPVVVQSTRTEAYRDAFDELLRAGRLYGCTCTRGDWSGPYPGTCRRRAPPSPGDGTSAARFALTADDPLSFVDRWQGRLRYTAAGLGDPVIWRRDGLVAYQLAVVVDDAHEAISDVVRGADLLDSTPWQLALYAALGRPAPTFAHAPLVTEPGGEKLAKSRRSLPLDLGRPGEELWRALRLLRQAPPIELAASTPVELLAWALRSWSPGRLYGVRTVGVDADENLGS